MRTEELKTNYKLLRHIIEQNFPLNELVPEYNGLTQNSANVFCVFHQNFSSPAAKLYWNDDNYYLIGWDEKHDDVTVFRIDRMEKVRTADSSDKIKSAIILEFHEGDKLSNKEIKSKLSKIYKDLGLTYNAKASDIEKYFETKRNRTRVDGKQIEGLELIKIK